MILTGVRSFAYDTRTLTRIASLGATRVLCDYLFDSAHRAEGHGRFCFEEFRSASVKSVLPAQLEYAGWTNRTTQRDGTQDFCPAHKPPHVTMEARYSKRM